MTHRSGITTRFQPQGTPATGGLIFLSLCAADDSVGQHALTVADLEGGLLLAIDHVRGSGWSPAPRVEMMMIRQRLPASGPENCDRSGTPPGGPDGTFPASSRFSQAGRELVVRRLRGLCCRLYLPHIPGVHSILAR